MTIDSHQHFWHFNAQRDTWITEEMSVIRRDFLPEELSQIYQQNEIDGCVAVQVNQVEEENHYFLQFAENHSFIKGIVGWVDFRSPQIELRLEYFSQFKSIKGFRHIVQAEPDDKFLLRDDFCNGISFLRHCNFTYDILVYHHQLAQVEPFVKKFPNQLFIIDHLAKPAIRERSIEPWKKYMIEIARHENVFCKISGLVTEANWKTWTYNDLEPYLNTVLEAFGPSRLLYGSDWPVCLVAASYEKQFSVVKQFISSLSESEKKKILGENAVQFYRL